jgi:hypothetical protein
MGGECWLTGVYMDKTSGSIEIRNMTLLVLNNSYLTVANGEYFGINTSGGNDDGALAVLNGGLWGVRQ